jgi:hypothetical protein
MNTEQIDQIVLANANKIDLDHNETIRQRLVGTEESTALTAFAELKSPTTVLLVSIFLGSLGIDRFILGQKFLGILKLVTGGGCFIWTIIDWFTSGDRTRTYNTKRLLERLSTPVVDEPESQLLQVE